MRLGHLVCILVAAGSLTACTAQNGASSMSPGPGSPGSTSGAGSSTDPNAATDGSDACPHPQPVSLGRPGIEGTATLTTSGGRLVFAASGFLHGGPLDPPQGATMLRLGDPAKPPVYDPARATVANTTIEVLVKEGEQKPSTCRLAPTGCGAPTPSSSRCRRVRPPP
jgi:hypothetical protein